MGFAVTQFSAEISRVRGEEAARVQQEAAAAAIRAVLPSATDEAVARYLNSVYGRFTAREVLEGRSVTVQLEARMTRFLKHYAEVQRNAR